LESDVDVEFFTMRWIVRNSGVWRGSNSFCVGDYWGWHGVCFCLLGKLEGPLIDTHYNDGVIITPSIPTLVKGAVEYGWDCKPVKGYSEPRRR